MKNRRRFIKSIRLAAGLLALPALLSLIVVFSGRIRSQSLAEERESLETAVRRCIVSCYALEGHYPYSLEYMEEHYGLQYDKSRFYIDYRPIAANIRPEYFILQTDGQWMTFYER